VINFLILNFRNQNLVKMSSLLNLNKELKQKLSKEYERFIQIAPKVYRYIVNKNYINNLDLVMKKTFLITHSKELINNEY